MDGGHSRRSGSGGGVAARRRRRQKSGNDGNGDGDGDGADGSGCTGGCGRVRAPENGTRRSQWGSVGCGCLCGLARQGWVWRLGSRLKSTRKHTNMMILADRVPTRDRIALPVRERDDPADRCSKAWPRRTLVKTSILTYSERARASSIACCGKWPGIALNILGMGYKHKFGVRGSTGQ